MYAIQSATGIVVPALFTMPVPTEDAANTVFFEAMSNRVMAEHNLNRRSSRSHVSMDRIGYLSIGYLICFHRIPICSNELQI